jgi:protein archease
MRGPSGKNYYQDAEQLFLFLPHPAITRDAGAYHFSPRACGELLTRFEGRLQADVKAVTLHRFEVTRLARGWIANVVLDI